MRRRPTSADVATEAGVSRTTVSFVLNGRTDCEKARRQIYAAISSSRYSDREINGWTCSSTSRSGTRFPRLRRLSRRRSRLSR